MQAFDCHDVFDDSIISYHKTSDDLKLSNVVTNNHAKRLKKRAFGIKMSIKTFNSRCI